MKLVVLHGRDIKVQIIKKLLILVTLQEMGNFDWRQQNLPETDMR